MKYSLFLCSISFICFAVNGAPLYSAEDDLKDYIFMVLENIRSEMATGIESLNIPPLEPFQLKDKVFDINRGDSQVKLEFPHLKVVGLSTFKADVDISLGSMGVEVDLSFDHIRANGVYNLNGKIMKIFPIYGNGDCSFDLQKPRIVVAANMGVLEDAFLITLTKLEVTWGDLKVHLGNFLGKGSLSRILEMLLPSLGQKMLNNFNPQILKAASEMLNKVLAEQSKKPEIKEILKNIFGEM